MFNHLADADAMIASLNSEPSPGCCASASRLPSAALRCRRSSASSSTPIPRSRSRQLYRSLRRPDRSRRRGRADRLPADLDFDRAQDFVQPAGLSLPRPPISSGTARATAPADLAAHHCLSFSHYSASGSVWRFKSGEQNRGGQDLRRVAVGQFGSDLRVRPCAAAALASWKAISAMKNIEKGDLVRAVA